MAVATGVGLYRYFTAPDRVRSMVERQLREWLPCPVSIGSVQFSLFGGLELGAIDIGPTSDQPSDAGGTASLSLRCERVQAAVDPIRLLIGQVRVDRVVAAAPVLDVVGDFKNAARPLAELRDRMRARGMERASRLPTVEIQGGELRLLRADGGAEVLDVVPLTIRARPAESGPMILDIAWQSRVEQSGVAQLDLGRGRFRDVRGGSPWVSAESAVSAFTPVSSPANDWRARLGVTGRVRARQFDLPLKGLRHEPGSTLLDLSGGTISIPAGREEVDLPPEARYLRFDRVEAEVLVKSDDIQATASAALDGSPVQMSGFVSGGIRALRDAKAVGYGLEVAVHGFALPATREEMSDAMRRAIAAKRSIEELYEDLNPSGPLDVEVVVKKATGAGLRPVLERVLVVADGASAVPKAFSLPIVGIHGEVEVKPDGVQVRDVCGTHGDGRICANGRFESPRSCSPAELTIIGEDVPIDDDLHAALGPDRADIKRLFDPRGRIDAKVVTTRHPCVNDAPSTWTTQTTVRLDSVSARYADLPYEIEQIGGAIQIHPGSAEIDVSGRVEDAALRAEASVVFGEKGARSVDLHVAADRLPIDDRLTTLVPEAARETVINFNPGGLVHIDADVRSSGPDQVQLKQAAVELLGVTVRHTDFPAQITDVRGRILIDPERVRLSQITGRYQEAQISLDGSWPGSSSEKSTGEPASIAVGVLDLEVDDGLIALAPNSIRTALQTWRVEGPISGDATLSALAGESRGAPSFSYRGEARLAGVSVRHMDLPAAFEKVHGIIRFSDTGIRAEDVRGRYANAHVRADVQMDGGAAGRHGTASVFASGMRLDEAFFDIFPSSTARSLRRLRPAGYIDVLMDRLQFDRDGKDGAWRWGASGSIQLHDVDLPSLKMAGVSGELTVSGLLSAAEQGTILAGEVHLKRASVLDRELTRIETPWSLVRTPYGVGELSFDRVRARLYEGEVSGRSDLRFDSGSAEYNLTGIIQGMQLGPFLNAGRPSEAQPIEARGSVAANLYLSGEFGVVESMRGGGRFDIVDGDLYKLPIILAILNVLELTARPTDAFEEASAEFYIVGSKVSLREIAIRGGLLALVGSGTLALPDLAADLRLVNVPDQWWARLPVLAEVMQGAVRELAEVRVTGPISQPNVRTEPVPRITDELRSLFQRRSGRPIPPSRR